MKKIVNILFFTFFCLNIFAQNEIGKYFVTTYTAKHFNTKPEILSVVKDNRGFLYFGTDDGLLEFDGNYWRHILSPNSAAMNSLGIDADGTVFAGGKNELGYLKPVNGKLDYISILHKLDTADQAFGTIRNIVAHDNKIFFRTSKRLFVYNKKTETFKVIYPPNSFYFPFLHNNKFYIFDKKKIFEYETDTLKQVTFDIYFDNIIRGVHPYKGDSLLFISNDFLTIYKLGASNSRIPVVDLDFHNFWRKTWVYTTLYSEYYKTHYLGTFDQGVMVLDQDFNLVTTINSEDGIADNFIWKMTLDNANGLWVATEKGISQIDVPSPISMWNEKVKLYGTIADVIRYKDIIYVTTSQNIFYLTKNQVTKFPYSLTQQCWKFLKYPTEKDTILLVGIAGGVHEIKNFDIHEIVKGFHANDLIISKTDKNIIYVLWNEGISRLKYENKKLNALPYLKNFEYAVRSFYESEDGYLLLSTDEKGIAKVKTNMDWDTMPNINYLTTKNGLTIDFLNYIFELDNQVYVQSEKDLLKYLPDKDTFIKADLFITKFFDANYFLAHFQKINDNKFFIVTKYEQSQKHFFIEKDKNNNWIKNDSTFRKIDNHSTIIYYAEDNGNLWLGGAEGLFKYNPNINKKYNTTHSAYIRKIYTTEDSVIYWGANQNCSHYKDTNYFSILEYKHNSLIFEYTSNDYQDKDNLLYSSYLQGYDKAWSHWTKDIKNKYTNLKEGKYTFKIKAKNLYNIESEIDEYSFQILAPWYRKWWAFTFYIIFAVAFVYSVVKLYTRRLVKQKERLEQIVLDRTAEIRQQKEEIETINDQLSDKNEELMQQREEIIAQSEELMRINTELEKLSIVAAETDNAVVIMDAEGNFEWINEGFTRLYGYDFNQFIEKYGTNISGVSSNNEIINLINICKIDKKSIIYESHNSTKNGEEVFTQTTLTPIVNSYEKVYKLIAIETDIRKLKEAQTVIENKNKELKVKNEHITSSIRYAQTIQTAILPFKDSIDAHFDNFIIFRPKDIVSGDFYWYAQVNNFHFIADIDCTGHGVPGAFMSMIGNTLLNQIVQSKNILETDNILSKLHELIVISLRQDKSDNNDGMDVCLCRIEKQADKTIVNFTGAKRPLYYYIQGDETITNLKGNRKSIGGTQKKQNIEEFTSTEIIFHTKGAIFLRSDGFTDQNDVNRSKYGSNQLIKVLFENINLPMKIQGQQLELSLLKWMDNESQRDDISFIGIAIDNQFLKN